MAEQPTLKEFTEAVNELPPEFKQQLAQVVSAGQEIDSVSIKMELVKFVSDLCKHNQGVDWETNKVKPKRIQVEDIIKGSQKLFDFIID